MNNKIGIWNTIITTTTIVVADYFIAKYLADTRSDVWWWISILLFVPLLFTLQVSAVRLIVGRVFLKRNSVNEFVHMMKDGAWPKPNRKYEDCDDYLQDVKNANVINFLPLNCKRLELFMHLPRNIISRVLFLPLIVQQLGLLTHRCLPYALRLVLSIVSL